MAVLAPYFAKQCFGCVIQIVKEEKHESLQNSQNSAKTAYFLKTINQKCILWPAYII